MRIIIIIKILQISILPVALNLSLASIFVMVHL